MDLDQLAEILENCEDEVKAAEYLRKFTVLTQNHHKLAMNQDPALDHQEWKLLVDKSQKELEILIQEIEALARA